MAKGEKIQQSRISWGEEKKDSPQQSKKKSWRQNGEGKFYEFYCTIEEWEDEMGWGWSAPQTKFLLTTTTTATKASLIPLSHSITHTMHKYNFFTI